MCKESQWPLHSLQNPWPCWSLGAAGHGLLSRGSTFSTAPLRRCGAEMSSSRLSPGRDARARVLWLTHTLYMRNKQWGQLQGETTSPENAEGDSSRLTHHLTFTARTWSPVTTDRETSVFTRMSASQANLNPKPKSRYITPCRCQPEPSSHIWQWKDRKEQSCQKGRL